MNDVQDLLFYSKVMGDVDLLFWCEAMNDVKDLLLYSKVMGDVYLLFFSVKQ